MKSYIYLLSCALILLSAIATVNASSTFSFEGDVLPWAKQHKLTKYDNKEDFRALDPISRGEAAKFTTQYMESQNIEATSDSNCQFDDVENYDSTLRPYITTSCGYGLFKGSKGKFKPHDNITQAQALAVIIRSLYGYQDESQTPWYQEYYKIGQKLGLVTNESYSSLESTPITREQLALWLYLAFQVDDKSFDPQEDNQYERKEGDVSVNGEGYCSSYEYYDAENDECYYECDSDVECEEIEAKINDELDSWTDSYEDDDRGMVGHDNDGYGGEGDSNGSNEQDSDEPQNSLVTYQVSPGEIIKLIKGSDSTKYQTVWSEVAALCPDTICDSYLSSFEIYNDAQSDISASVHDDDGDGKWSMSLNLAHHDEVDNKEQKAIIIHELAHIITLNNKQLIANQKTCTTYNTYEGCATKNSYLYQFVTKFRGTKTSQKYSPSTFVTEYATSSQEEDIAESFAYFVLESNHDNSSIRNQKVNFFNQFPELVQMRDSMRSTLSKDILRAKKSK